MRYYSARMLLAAGLIYGLSVPASAESSAQQAFDATDTNNDGLISREEYRHRMIEVFYAADADVDGELSRTELADADTSDSQFRDADTNRDSKLQLREFLNFRAHDFERLDVDNDGILKINDTL